MKIKTLLAGCLLIFVSAGAARANWTATGQFNYTDRLYNINGWTSTGSRPVREADVQVYDISTNAVLASGSTNATGNFSIAVTDSATRNVGVRVLSSNVQVASLNFSVVDDANADAIYSYHDAFTDEVGHGPNVNVNFGIMIMPASIGAVATTSRASQIFNMYDMGLLAADWVASVDGARPTVFLKLGWNPTNGRGGSFYSPNTKRVSISDNDAYDDPNILHEIGHYVDDVYGRLRNPGGYHAGDNDQDPRLAYSEGFATFVSGAAMITAGRTVPHIYQDRDSFATGTGDGFSYNFESAINGGATNETAVTAALYDLVDSAATLDGGTTDDDPMAGQQANVWAVVEQMRVLDLTATSMEDFWDIWFSLGFGNAANMAAVFTAHSIDFAPDAQEPNNSVATATLLTSGLSYQRNSFFRSGAVSGGDEDWFKFTAEAGRYYLIEVDGTNGAIFGRPDPEMWLINSAVSEVLAYNDDPNDTTLNTQDSVTAQDMAETVPSILWEAPANGVYYLYLRHAAHARGLLGRYGTYNIRVSSTELPPQPGITSVSAQRMRQGQSYQALILGTGFVRGATVTTNNAGVAVTKVNWLSPTAMVVTLTPSGAVANGSYLLVVTNSETRTGSLPNAFEVHSSAEPPLRITEVNRFLGAVEVKNLGTIPADLDHWKLVGRERTGGGFDSYTFPFGVELAPGSTVVVSEDLTGGDTDTDLYYSGINIDWAWANGGYGDLSLVDNFNRNVDFIPTITSPTSTTYFPAGIGGAWMTPQIQSPATGYSLARSEGTALYRTPFGLSPAKPTMPEGAANRANEVDPFEDNDQPRRAPILSQETSVTGLRISPRTSGTDEDWFGFFVKPGDRLQLDVTFTHAAGDIDMKLYAPGQETIALISSGTLSNNERITLTSSQSNLTGGGLYRLRVYGYNGAVNNYTLTSTTDGPEIMVRSNGGGFPLIISDGDTTPSTLDGTDFGSAAPTARPDEHEFAIYNSGTLALNLSGTPRVQISGAHAADFTVTTVPAGTVAIGTDAIFGITFEPGGLGLRTATVSIINDDNDENPYNFNIQGTGLPSTDANLVSLTTTAGTLAPSFTSANITYSASVSNMTDVILVTPTRSESHATIQVRVNGGSYASVTSGGPSDPLALNVGANPVEVKVTAQDGITIKTYTITVTRSVPLSPEMNLKGNGLTIADGDSTPDGANHSDFGAAAVTGGLVARTFTIENTGNVNLTLGAGGIILGGSHAAEFTTSGLPASVAPGGSTTFQINFNPEGAGTRSATVSIPNNDADENPYNFSIQGTGVPSSNADLGSLVVTTATLAPAFTSGGVDYTATVPNATASVAVTASAAQADATLDARVNGGGYTNIFSGVPSSPLALNVGANLIEVRATAQDGTTIKTYSLTITRLDVAPTVTAINPASGSTAGGTSVTITGTTFTGSTEVSFGGTAAVFTVVNATTITATPPPHAAGLVNVIVTTPGGTGTGTDLFTYITPITDYAITTDATSITITDLTGNGDALSMTESAGYVFTAAGRTFSLNGAANVSGSITLPYASHPGITSITLHAEGGDDTVSIGAFAVMNFPSLIINGGSGNDQVNLTDDLNFALHESLSIDLQDDALIPGTDSITIGTDAELHLTGSGSAVLKASKNITFLSGSALTAADGGITLEANQQLDPTAGSTFDGITLTLATITNQGASPISIKGHSGDFASGISLTQSTVQNAASGAITLIGTAVRGSNFAGVKLDASSLGVADGTLTINGANTGTKPSNERNGVFISGGSALTSSNVGDIAITGTGAAAAGTFNSGIVLLADSSITTDIGDVTLLGTGGQADPALVGDGFHGIDLRGKISTVSGDIILNGTAGTNDGSGNIGVLCGASGLLSGEANLRSKEGNITLTGSSQISQSLYLDSSSGSVIDTTSGAGAVTLIGDTIELSDFTASGALVIKMGSGSALTFTPLSAGRSVILGAADDATPGGHLGLLKNEITRCACDTWFIGDSITGMIHIQASMTFTDSALTLTTQAGFGIEFEAGGQLDTGAGSVTLSTGSQGVITHSTASSIIASSLQITAAGGIGGDGVDATTFAFQADTLTTSSKNPQRLAAFAAPVTIAPGGLHAHEYDIQLTAGTWVLAGADGILSTTTVSAGATLRGIGTTEDLTLLGTLTPGTSAGIIHTADFNPQAGSTLNIEIGGTTPGKSTGSHDQVNVTGVVELTGNPTLNLSAIGGFVPAAGQTFTIINNDGADAIAGTFANRAQGALIRNFLGSALSATISYTGGSDSNDVVLTVLDLAADPDTDGLNNLLEIAFETDPNDGTSGPPVLSYSGTLASFTLVSTGQPLIVRDDNGIDFRAIYLRRADHLAVGLIYTAEFSSDVVNWFPIASTPDVLTTSGNVQAVSLLFPQLLPDSQPARFFRLHISLAP